MGSLCFNEKNGTQWKSSVSITDVEGISQTKSFLHNKGIIYGMEKGIIKSFFYNKKLWDENPLLDWHLYQTGEQKRKGWVRESRLFMTWTIMISL